MGNVGFLPTLTYYILPTFACQLSVLCGALLHCEFYFFRNLFFRKEPHVFRDLHDTDDPVKGTEFHQ